MKKIKKLAGKGVHFLAKKLTNADVALNKDTVEIHARLKAQEEHINELQEALEFEDNKIVSIYMNDSNSKISSLKALPPYNKQSNRTYIGKIEKNKPEGGMYNTSFFRALFHQLYNYANQEDITIVIAPIVSTICNGEDKENMSNQDMIVHIKENIIKKYFPKKTNKVYFEALEDRPNQKKLFEKIKKLGLDNYSKTYKTESLIGTNSSDIFSYLLSCIEKDEKLRNDIFAITPSEAIQTTYGKYYSLVEIACRISDYFNGITQQRGAGKQKDYDQIIASLLNPQAQKYKSTKLSTISESDDFIRINIQHGHAQKFNKKTEKVEATSNKLQKVNRNIKTLLWGVLLGASLVAGTSKFVDYKKTKEREQEFIEYVEKQTNKSYYEGRIGSGESLLSSWDDIYKKIFENHFNIKDKEVLKKIKYSFLERYVKKHNKGLYNASIHGSDYSIIDVIEDYLLEKGADLQEFYNISITPWQENFKEYEQAFYNTTTHDSLPGDMADYTVIKPLSIPNSFGGSTEYNLISNGKSEFIVLQDNKTSLGPSSYTLQNSYFIPLNSRYISNKLSKVFAEEISPGGYLSTYTIKEQLITLNMHGYNIDYLLGTESKYSENIKSILGTFFKDIVAQDKLEKLSDKTTEIEQIMNTAIDAFMYEEGYYDRIVTMKPGSRDWNKLFSAIFNVYLSNPIYQNTITEKGIKERLNKYNSEISKYSGFRFVTSEMFQYVRSSEKGILTPNLTLKHGHNFTSEKLLRTYGCKLQGEYETLEGEIFSRGYMYDGVSDDDKVLIAIPKNDKLQDRYFKQYISKYFQDKYPYTKENSEIVEKIGKIDEKGISEKFNNNVKESQYWHLHKNEYRRISDDRNRIRSVFKKYNNFYGEILYQDHIKKEEEKIHHKNNINSSIENSHSLLP